MNGTPSARRLARIFSLPARAVRLLLSRPDAAALLAEAWASLAWSRILLFLPFRRIAPRLGATGCETAWRELPREARMEAERIADAVRIASRCAWWECKCLVRAMAAMRMLKRRGIESTLYLGTGRDEAGRLAAHAWLRSGSRYITGAEERRRFTVVGMYAAGARDLERT